MPQRNIENDKEDVETANQFKRPGKEIEITEQDMKTTNLPLGNGAESPKLLRIREESCIFRIPKSLADVHHKGYEPEIVSIGPYHHGKKHLKMIEEHKPRYLQLFLAEASRDGVNETTLTSKIMDIVESEIRNSYSENLDVDNSKLVKMMLLDGCFILMLIFFFSKRIDSAKMSPNDPILNTPWILSTIRSDLILLENQVPFILLEKLFEDTLMSRPGSRSLKDLVLKFYNFKLVEKNRNTSRAKHLLDLVRKVFIPISSENGDSHTAADVDQRFSRLILSTKRLRLQGIKFKDFHNPSSKKGFARKMIDFFFNESNAFIPRISDEEHILEIQLKGVEVQIPPIDFDVFISLVLLNCVAFEQLSMKCSNDVTSYVVFMGCLMSDEEDVIYLSEKGIIENYFGNANDIAQFFKKICNGVSFDMQKSYLKDVFQKINKYTTKRRHVECARFMRLYFDSPWSCLSSCAVLAILLLTTFQAAFAALAYFHPPNQPNQPH